MKTAARIPDANEPNRVPDGATEDGQFYFWLGDEGVEDSDLDDDTEADSETN